METSTKVIGMTIVSKGPAATLLPMDLFTRANSSIIYSTVRVNNSGPMAPPTTEVIKKEKSTVKAYMPSQTDNNMMAIGKMAANTAKAHKRAMMERSEEEFGKLGKG